MTKQLFLCLMAGTLVIAPGCTKRTKTLTYIESVEILDPVQLEKDRESYKTSGIALTTAGAVTYAGGLTCIACAPLSSPATAGEIGLIVSGAVIGLAGAYMLGQGIDNLAKAKKLRRMQMKEAAQKRKLAREAAREAVIEAAI